ncbi:MAG: DUF559 domain-containing protein, partial [Microlunatus sp.]|nr:DUF559 domain-containing protein [Microlunatus sp.]
TTPVKRSQPLDLSQPFSRVDARAAGLTVRRLLGPEFQRIFYDRYVSSAVVVDTQVRARAAIGLCPEGSFVSHQTAADLWGGVAPFTPSTHVSVPAPEERLIRQGIQSHLVSAGQRSTILLGLQVSTPEQTFIDLATTLDLVDLVVLGDSLLHAGATTLERLSETVSVWRGRGARRARRGLRYVRVGVDSAMESRLRMLLVLAGLPEPNVNHIVYDKDGRWFHRYDLCYEDVRLIVEYDGRQHAENSEQWQRDLTRRAWLDRNGWRIIVVTAAGIYRQPGETLAEVRDALKERGMRVPARFRPDWYRHFPGTR